MKQAEWTNNHLGNQVPHIHWNSEGDIWSLMDLSGMQWRRVNYEDLIFFYLSYLSSAFWTRIRQSWYTKNNKAWTTRYETKTQIKERSVMSVQLLHHMVQVHIIVQTNILYQSYHKSSFFLISYIFKSYEIQQQMPKGDNNHKNESMSVLLSKKQTYTVLHTKLPGQIYLICSHQM